ncbi:hypothetical protein BSZ35_14930 [Salinibacter sp. 10B]|nr:hypothetical protein BSZ35_14930 [Salinibacter sp. 10B]
MVTFTGPKAAWAQLEGPSLRSVQRPVSVSVDPTYQVYETEGGRQLTEFSTRLSMFVPVTTRLTVRARGEYARMDGTRLTSVGGGTDLSGQVSYAQPVADGSVVFSLQANAPTGKQKLSDAELETTRFISQNVYDFRVSSFSRGFSLAPRVTWAVPLSDRFAVGLGAGYQYQRGFRPQASLEEDYVPGDGVGANGGFDYKLTEASALGLDVAYRWYQTDRVGGVPRFDSGSRLTGTVRYLRRSGFTTIRAVVRYANWEESEFGFRRQSPNRGQVLPPHGMVLTSYETRLAEGMRLHLRASGHWYGETIQDSPMGNRKLLGRAYVSPSFEIGEVLTLEPHGTASFGSYRGYGGGLRMIGTF